MKPKFEPKEIVKLKYGKGERFCIHESIVQKCPGGTQIHYQGRIINKSERLSSAMVFTKNDWRFMEHELESLKIMTNGSKL